MFIDRVLSVKDVFPRNEMQHFVPRENAGGGTHFYKHLAPPERKPP
jgi:hypothetical protein